MYRNETVNVSRLEEELRNDILEVQRLADRHDDGVGTPGTDYREAFYILSTAVATLLSMVSTERIETGNLLLSLQKRVRALEEDSICPS